MGWVRVCSRAEAPPDGTVTEADAGGVMVCLGNVNGELSGVDNTCPHRGGPLGQGIVSRESVVCPWHAWTFNLKTGLSEPPGRRQVKVYPVRIEGEDVLVQLD